MSIVASLGEKGNAECDLRGAKCWILIWLVNSAYCKSKIGLLGQALYTVNGEYQSLFLVHKVTFLAVQSISLSMPAILIAHMGYE